MYKLYNNYDKNVLYYEKKLFIRHINYVYREFLDTHFPIATKPTHEMI